jgi:Protein of unknown function (DUF2817)
MGISQYFSASYTEARGKFLAATGAFDASIEAHVNSNAKGAEGEELALEVARFGDRDAESLLIVCSGTHGNEGFCGSFCQTAFIEEGVIDARPRTVTVLLVHAVNPYGFSHIRRVTENNVDLNRNYRDFSKPPPENPRYAEIHELLVPADWDGPARAKADATLKVWLQANGMPAYQAAVAGGQYAFPDGLFFGGYQPTWSNATFRAILRSHGAAAKRVGVIDIHTGLGPPGYGEPISVVAPGAPEFKRARAWWGDEVTSVTDGTSKSPPVTGSLIGAIEESLPHAETTSIGLEFGTVPLAEVVEAIRGDNWLYARGLRSGLSMESQLARDIKTKIRDALTLHSDGWMEKVYARAADFVSKAYSGLAE